MLQVKFFLFVLCSICLIIFNSKAYSQEKIEKTITEKEVGQIILVFPSTEDTTAYKSGGKSMAAFKLAEKAKEVNLKSFVKAFKGFKVKQIEVWISMVVETAGFTKLFVSSKGEGGIKVLLEPE